MPRRTYNPRHGRGRQHAGGHDWTWLVELLRHERKARVAQ